MKFRATAEELARGQLVSPGWQVVEMKTAVEKPDKSGAGLLIVEATVIGGKEEDKGAGLHAQFSEKAQGMIAPFYAALTGQKWDGKEIDIRTKDVSGKKMEWFVHRGEWKGKGTNDVVDFRPVQS